MASRLRDVVVGAGVAASERTRSTVDSVLSPTKRQEIIERLTEFAKERPILATFLLLNGIFSGIPVVGFLIFGILFFIFSIVTAILTALAAALIISGIVLGFSLLFLVPFLMFTTFVATSLGFWAICGYYLITFARNLYMYRISKASSTATQTSTVAVSNDLHAFSGQEVEKNTGSETAVTTEESATKGFHQRVPPTQPRVLAHADEDSSTYSLKPAPRIIIDGAR